MRFGSIITPMVIDMNEQQLCTVAQIRAFLDGTREVQFDPIGEDSKRYAFIGAVVRRLRYGGLSRVEKGIVMRNLGRTTGYSIAQLKRLVDRVRAGETLAKGTDKLTAAARQCTNEHLRPLV